jgi:hypothetical protein
VYTPLLRRPLGSSREEPEQAAGQAPRFVFGSGRPAQGAAQATAKQGAVQEQQQPAGAMEQSEQAMLLNGTPMGRRKRRRLLKEALRAAAEGAPAPAVAGENGTAAAANSAEVDAELDAQLAQLAAAVGATPELKGKKKGRALKAMAASGGLDAAERRKRKRAAAGDRSAQESPFFTHACLHACNASQCRVLAKGWNV